MQLAACHVRKLRWNPPLSFPPPTPTGIAGVRSPTILHIPSLSLHIVKLDLRVPSRPTTSDFDTADNAELNKTKLVMCAHAGGAGWSQNLQGEWKRTGRGRVWASSHHGPRTPWLPWSLTSVRVEDIGSLLQRGLVDDGRHRCLLWRKRHVKLRKWA